MGEVLRCLVLTTQTQACHLMTLHKQTAKDLNYRRVGGAPPNFVLYLLCELQSERA